MQTLPFYLIYLMPAATLVGYRLGGAWNFLTALIIFVSVPLIDLVVGADKRNPTPAEEAAIADAFRFKAPTWFCAPTQIGLMLWGAYILTHRVLTPVEAVGLTLSIGLNGGVMGINVGHELVHRLNGWEQFLGRSMLWTVSYLHWGLEHVAGHHRMVATPHDPATALYGWSFYRFWPRTVGGGFRSSWNIEKARLAHKQKRLWGPANRIIWYVALTVALVAAMIGAWGWLTLPYFIVQSLIAISLLEVVNYLEHYGLLRAKGADGAYERVLPKHAWNNANLLTNLFLFNLQRHSDHHHKPQRRYQILRHVEEAPQLPTGYGGMLLLALVPPLWFRVMDPKVPEEMKELYRKEIVAGLPF
jgi:alkane 1-monooxygenase